jgi:LacI family transcriptional regulator
MTPSRPNLASESGARYVAAKAGVSLMTVSRVFSNSERVSEATRRRVLEAAREVGYVPNSWARALRQGHSRAVAFIVASPGGLRGEFHSDTLSAFEAVVSSCGLSLDLTIPDAGEKVSDLVRRLVASNAVRGAVIRFDVLPPDELGALAEIDAPIMVASLPTAGGDWVGRLGFVGFDNAAGIRAAVRHLYSLGHREIAYLGGTPGWVDSLQREAGFRAGMQECGLKLRADNIRACDFGEGFSRGAEAMDAILSASDATPTAVVCASDVIAAGAMASARRWNRTVPDDLSVVGFDDNNWCLFFHPHLTTVRHFGMELGDALGHAFMSKLEDPARSLQPIVLETPLIVRESTARPRTAAKSGKD